ncbi:jg17940 [Pararge aegeria aegeria]|uniref:Jg17940 protein n=1 Tax=Pararge aegeria aegeria TaxID=348720 RepID=A0A8S4RD73_9NEOP|nr:jg17940 [Pararge aegeria aegeria]
MLPCERNKQGGNFLGRARSHKAQLGTNRYTVAALVDPRRDGQTTSSASQIAAGSKWHKTVEFGIPYKRPMSSRDTQL